MILQALPLVTFDGSLVLGAFVLMLPLMIMLMLEVRTIITESWPLTDRLSCARLCDLHSVSLDRSPPFKAGHTAPITQLRPVQVMSQGKSPCRTSKRSFPWTDRPPHVNDRKIWEKSNSVWRHMYPMLSGSVLTPASATLACVLLEASLTLQPYGFPHP